MVQGQLSPLAVQGEVSSLAVQGQLSPLAVQEEVSPLAVQGRLSPLAVQEEVLSLAVQGQLSLLAVLLSHTAPPASAPAPCLSPLPPRNSPSSATAWAAAPPHLTSTPLSSQVSFPVIFPPRRPRMTNFTPKQPSTSTSVPPASPPSPPPSPQPTAPA